MSNKNQISKIVEIKPGVIKYVLGRDRENLKTLQTKYPDLHIFLVRGEKNGIVVEGNTVSLVDYCVKDINNYVMSSFLYLENRQKSKKINKEKLAKKKSIQAINKIKDNIKRNEEEQDFMKQEIENAKVEGREVKSIKKQETDKDFNKLLTKNYFYGLDN